MARGLITLGIVALLAACTPAADPPTTTAATTTTNSTSTTSTSITTTSTTSTTSTTTTTTTVPPNIHTLARSVLMVGLPGPTLDETTAAHLAGGGRAVIYYNRNITDAEQVRALGSQISCAAGGPVLIAVDHEIGVPVRRLAGLVSPLPSATEAQQMSGSDLEMAGRVLGEEMLDLGINVDLAPVIDVVRGANPVLTGRHLGADPDLVAQLGAVFIRGLGVSGVVAVPKHFPGHGLSTTDPHSGVTTIDAGIDELASVDWVPFRAAIDAGALMIMVGHPIYPAIDPDLPASISPAVLDLLRTEFGFDGVAVTDEVTMQGVASGRSPGERAVLALAAGEDLVLVKTGSQVEEMVDAIVAAVDSGELSLERLQEAAGRVTRVAEAAATVECHT